MVEIGWAYIVLSMVIFIITLFNDYNIQNGYFKTLLIYFHNPSTNFILHNVILATAMLIYKLSILVFFVDVKQNESIKIADRLKNKLIDLIFFIYIIRGQLSIEMFMCIIIIILSFILHNQAIFRSQFLIHTPTITSLSLNYKLLAFILIVIFIDFEILLNCISWLSSEDGVSAMFIYYMVIISMSILEPTAKYLADFYQKYTFHQIPNIDQHLVVISVLINIPRFIIQLLLAIWISRKFSFTFFFLITSIELIYQLSNTIKSYRNMKKLTETMRNLKRIDSQQLNQMHDSTCMICFLEMLSAILLPCKHAFHQQCLRQWIIKNSNHFCPKCKKPFNFDAKQAQNVQQRVNPGQRRDNRQRDQIFNRQVRYFIPPKQGRNQQQKNNINTTLQNKSKSQSQNKPIHQNFIQKQPLEQEQQSILQSTINKLKIGSLPYALPTEAVYNRTVRDMYKRESFITRNESILKILKLPPIQQILTIPS